MFQFSVPQGILYQCVEEEKIWKSDNGCNSLYIMICAAHCQNFSVTCTSSILVTSITWHCWYHMIRCTLSSLVISVLHGIAWYCMIRWTLSSLVTHITWYCVVLYGIAWYHQIRCTLSSWSGVKCRKIAKLSSDQHERYSRRQKIATRLESKRSIRSPAERWKQLER